MTPRPSRARPGRSAPCVKWATDDFRARGIESPRLDAEVLLARALGATRMQLIVDAKRPLAPDELARFRELVKRRRAREPVAYILGEREFYGRTFRVDARVLVPRPDTETLVEVALARTRARVDVDARARPVHGQRLRRDHARARAADADVVGADVSADALAVARENALRLGAYNVAFVACESFGGLRRRPRFDVVTANPPYIASARDRDALRRRRALRAAARARRRGRRARASSTRIVDEAPRHLAPGGVLAVEVGAGQAPKRVAAASRRGLSRTSRSRATTPASNASCQGV